MSQQADSPTLNRPLMPYAWPSLFGAHAAHAVVLGGPHGNELVDGIHAEEAGADLVHLAQLAGDVLFAQVADVEPEVLAIGALDALAQAHVVRHPAANHVTAGQLLLLRLVDVHEALLIHVEQRAAVAAAAFRHQDVRGHDARGVELHGLHVAHGDDAGVDGRDVPAAVADDGVGGAGVDAPEPAGGDGGGLGQVHAQFAGAQAARHAAEAGHAVVDERDGLGLVVHLHAQLGADVVDREQHAVSRAVGHVAGAPFGRAAEVARGDEPAVLFLFFLLELLAALEVHALAGHHAVPGHPPVRQLAHLDGRVVGKEPGHFLVAAPVGALDRVGEVHVRAVALALGAVAQGGLHAAHGGRGMRAPGGHKAQTDGGEARLGGLDGRAFAGQAGPDDEYVGVDCLHIPHPILSGTRSGSA
jgi:hypothetical protein